MENLDEIKTTETSSKVSVFRNALNYGLYTSIAFLLFSLLMYVLDVNRESLLQYFGFVIIIAGIVLAIINYRDKINGGYITFGKAFLTGFNICILVGLVAAIYSYALFNFIDTSAVQEMMDAAEQKLADKGLSDEMIDQQIAMTTKFMTPAIISISSLFGTVFFGSIISLIIAAILKKNDDSFNTTFPQ